MGQVTTLQARRSSTFQWYRTVQLVDLRGLDVVTDVLTVPAQRAVDAGHECPMGLLGGKGRQWECDYSTWRVRDSAGYDIKHKDQQTCVAHNWPCPRSFIWGSAMCIPRCCPEPVLP